MEQNYSSEELRMIEWSRMKAEYDYNTQMEEQFEAGFAIGFIQGFTERCAAAGVEITREQTIEVLREVLKEKGLFERDIQRIIADL